MGRLSASGVYMQPEIILAQLRALLERTPDFMLYTPASRDHQMWLGHAHAQKSLGLMYFIGRGVPKNDEIAVKWYKKAAVQGDTVAYFSLGWMYYNGVGVPKI
jgi:TPR repeat protein